MFETHQLLECSPLQDLYMPPLAQPPIQAQKVVQFHKFPSQKTTQKAPAKSKQTNSLTEAYRKIINTFEETKPSNISIVNVARDYGIQHRRVYDLFNLLTYLGVCQNIERGKLAWIGLDCFKTAVAKAYAQIEIDSITLPVSKIFCLGPSPSLGQIATHFISMYLFFGVDTLLLKQVSSIFHDPRADIKSLERRMYLVLSFLELMGIVSHTTKTNEYKLIADLSAAQNYAIEQKKKVEKIQCPLSLENLLNTSVGPYTSDLKLQRLLECPVIHV